jgi:hypothetical protein
MDKETTELFGDPEPETTIEETPDEEPEAPVEGEEEEASEKLDFGGLPFKDVKEFVKAHKSLQKEFTTRNEEIKNLQATVNKLIPHLTSRQQTEVKKNPEEFFQSFLEDPVGVLNTLIEQKATGVLKSGLDPLQTRLTGIDVEAEMNAFSARHPELNDEDEENFLELMDEYKDVLKGRKDRLEVLYKIYAHDHPEVRERAQNVKKDLSRGLEAAKKGAGMGGRKSSVKAPERDEFDDVVDMWKTKIGRFK